MYGFTFDNNSKNSSRDILKWFLYISRSSLVHSTNNLFDAPNVSRLIIHALTHQRRCFLSFLFSKICWHSFIKQSHITTTPSRTSSFAAILKSTASINFVEQYRSTVEFNFIDSTALINLGDRCKRALPFPTSSSKYPFLTSFTSYPNNKMYISQAFSLSSNQNCSLWTTTFFLRPNMPKSHCTKVTNSCQ